jgi:branched-chain amino acid transport system ATP-binding protein
MKGRLTPIFLEINELSKYFGGLAAIAHFDMSVKEGDIVGLIGPNDAGKTTLFNLVTGGMSPTTGKVIFDKKDITGRKPRVIAEP